MNDKKGFLLLGDFTVKLVISLIVLVILIYLGYKVYNLFVEDNELKKASLQLEKISDTIKIIQSTGETAIIDFFPPRKGWFLRTFPDYDFPEGECNENNIVSCLCLCSELICQETRKCEGYPFNVKVDKLAIYSTEGNIAVGIGGQELKYPEVLELTNNAYELKIIKEDGMIKIRTNN